MSTNQAGSGPGRWVLLCYRVPREPSTPRIGVWRNLEWFFPPAEREQARSAVQALGAGLVELSPGRAPGSGRERG